MQKTKNSGKISRWQVNRWMTKIFIKWYIFIVKGFITLYKDVVLIRLFKSEYKSLNEKIQ